MGDRHTVTVSDEELAKWVRDVADDGPFDSIGHVHREALKRLHAEVGDDPSVADMAGGYDF